MTEKKRNFDDTGALWINDSPEWNADYTGVIMIDGKERKIQAKEVLGRDSDSPAQRKRQPAIRIFVLPECM